MKIYCVIHKRNCATSFTNCILMVKYIEPFPFQTFIEQYAKFLTHLAVIPLCNCTHRCKFSHQMWHRPSHGTRSVDHKTSLAPPLRRSRCRSRTCPSHCRSCHQVSCSGAGMTLWTVDTHHPPGWEKYRRLVVI